jgi:hypothetical protein
MIFFQMTDHLLAGELVVGFIFSNVYTPSPDDNPFAFAVSYCNKTGTALFPGGNLSVVGRNYAIFYNHSGEIAILFDCGPLEDNGYPLNSPGAICNGTVLGCFSLNLYRFLVEVVDVLEKTACYLSELVQFEGTACVNAFLNQTFYAAPFNGTQYYCNASANTTFLNGPNTSVCVTNNYVCNQVRVFIHMSYTFIHRPRPRSTTLTRRACGVASSTSASACVNSFTFWTCSASAIPSARHVNTRPQVVLQHSRPRLPAGVLLVISHTHTHPVAWAIL